MQRSVSFCRLFCARCVFALVLFQDLEPRELIVFKKPLSKVCAFLGKRHGNQDATLQLTQRNYERIIAQRDAATQLGLEIYDLGHD